MKDKKTLTDIKLEELSLIQTLPVIRTLDLSSFSRSIRRSFYKHITRTIDVPGNPMGEQLLGCSKGYNIYYLQFQSEEAANASMNIITNELKGGRYATV